MLATDDYWLRSEPPADEGCREFWRWLELGVLQLVYRQTKSERERRRIALDYQAVVNFDPHVFFERFSGQLVDWSWTSAGGLEIELRPDTGEELTAA